MIYLVRYKDCSHIEGYVQNKTDFKKWLKKHNEHRIKEGEIIEQEYEFELNELKELKESD